MRESDLMGAYGMRPDPEPVAVPPDPEQVAAFFRRVERSGGHWLWRGEVTQRRHAVFDGMSAARFAYELGNGHPPEGAIVVRHCGEPLCVFPDHLTPMNRRQMAGQQHLAVERRAAERGSGFGMLSTSRPLETTG